MAGDSSVNILLVTQDPSVAQLRKTLLSRNNFNVTGTMSGVEAFNRIKFDHPDLALIDLALEDSPGDEVCRDIKTDPQTKGTVVAVLIEGNDEWFAKRARDAGADHVVSKPISPDELEKIIASILHTPVRKSIRVPVRILVEGATASMGEMKGHTADISATGMQLVMQDCKLETGFFLWLKFVLPGTTAPVICKAQVMRIQSGREYNLGLHFKAFKGTGASLMRNFLRAQGADVE